MRGGVEPPSRYYSDMEDLATHAESHSFFARLNDVMGMIKIAHTIFAMPFAMIGVIWGFLLFDDGISLAPAYWPMADWLWVLIWVVAAMVGARSYAMTINRLFDAKIDAANPRTAGREIPAGKVTPAFAWGFALGMLGLFLVASAMLNLACLMLAPLAIVVITLYSFMKRFSALCHLVLGLGLSFAPIGGFVAVMGHSEIAPWRLAFASPAALLGLGVLTWVAGFDVIYSLQDEEYDRGAGLHSIPAALGGKRALRLSRFLHMVTIGAWVFALMQLSYWMLAPVGVATWVGVAICAACLAYEHSLVKHDDLSRVNASFFTLNGVIAIVFALCVGFDAWMA